MLLRLEEDDDRPTVTYRRSGERNLLIEYGPDVLDLDLRARVHSLAAWLASNDVDGVIDVTPGIRSLQVHFDTHETDIHRVLDVAVAAEAELPSIEDMQIPSRIVHLPLSWDDPSTLDATERYMLTVRDDAPWCPHNLEFIRRINGLESIDDVYKVVFDASYLVLGLGDVYLGAPVATPIDPRQRLVTTKYNPARTWTPENAVGIGGAYLCIYGMEGPGGYQFVGRTVPVWNTWHHDQRVRHVIGRGCCDTSTRSVSIRSSADELLDLRHDLLIGRTELAIDETTFDLAEHHRFLDRDQRRGRRQCQAAASGLRRGTRPVGGRGRVRSRRPSGCTAGRVAHPVDERRSARRRGGGRARRSPDRSGGWT